MDTRRFHSIVQSASYHPLLIVLIIMHLFPSQLETDSKILIPKARGSLERYGHQLVIGNLLNTRKYEVVLVSRRELIQMMVQTPSDSDGSTNISNVPDGEQLRLERTEDGDFVQDWLRLREGRTEIEEDLIAQLVKYHDAWIRTPNKQKVQKTTQ
jgi:phosphopantothenate-cysteine ligase